MVVYLTGFTREAPATPRAAAGDAIAAREIDLVRVVGRRTPVRVFEPLARREGLDARGTRALEVFSAALRACRARDFTAAERDFAEVLALDPADPPARLWLERARAWRSQPPPDWDDVHELDTK